MIIEIGQPYLYTNSTGSIKCIVIGITEKSVKISYYLKFYYSDYPVKRISVISKEQFKKHMSTI